MPGYKMSDFIRDPRSLSVTDRYSLLCCFIDVLAPRQSLTDLPIGGRKRLAVKLTHKSQDFLQTLPLSGILQLP
jgi:hypothetical protein